jgi:hypothetical protein
MPNYAIITASTVENVVLAEADYAASQGWIECPAEQPVGAGWTYDGTTWTAPAPTPDPLAAPRATIATLLAEQPTLSSQLEADIASVANWDSLTSAERAAILGRILQNGLGNAMQAIVAHLQLTGNAPT